MKEKAGMFKIASVLEGKRAAQGKLQARQQGCKGMWAGNGKILLSGGS